MQPALVPLWCLGIKATGIGTVGMVLNFVVTLSLTPLFPAPPAEIQAMVDDLRTPEGDAPLAVGH